MQAWLAEDMLRTAAILLGVLFVVGLLGFALWVTAMHLIHALNQHLDE